MKNFLLMKCKFSENHGKKFLKWVTDKTLVQMKLNTFIRLENNAPSNSIKSAFTFKLVLQTALYL